MSLIGVVLIARPEALFGASSPSKLPDVPAETTGMTFEEDAGSSTQRLIAIGFAQLFQCLCSVTHEFISVALVGPLGAAGACACYATRSAAIH